MTAVALGVGVVLGAALAAGLVWWVYRAVCEASDALERLSDPDDWWI